MKIDQKTLVLAEFIPVILALFYYLDSFQFLMFTHTVLGKLLLLSVVILYTLIDQAVGTFFCLLYIFYYQTDFSDIMRTMYLRDRKNFVEKFESIPAPKAPEKTDKGKAAEFVEKHCLRGQLMNPAGTGKVNQEMLEHVFPELGFSRLEGKCNPCDKSCNFSIIETKLQTEEIMKTPKSSNSWYDKMTLFIGGKQEYSVFQPISVPGVISEAFSLFS